MDTLEQLLGVTEKDTQAAAPADEEEKTDVSGEGNTDNNPDTKADKGLRKEVEKLREERRIERAEREKEKQEREALQAQLNQLKETVKPIERMREPEEPVRDPALVNTTENWQHYIGKTADEKVKPIQSDFDKLKQSNKSKALRNFVKEHPEYSLSQEGGRGRLEGLMSRYERIKSRSDLDHEDIFEDLQDAWAIENRSIIEEKASSLRQSELQAEQDSVELASSGQVNSDKQIDPWTELTPMERKVAKELEIDPATYRKLKPLVR